MEITEIRRERLRRWFANKPVPPKEKSYISQLMGRSASFGERAARRLERDYGMGEKYLDQPLSDSGPQLSPVLSEEQEVLLERWAFLLPEQQSEIRSLMQKHIDQNRAVLERFGKQPKVASTSNRVTFTDPEYQEPNDISEQKLKLERRKRAKKVELERRKIESGEKK